LPMVSRIAQNVVNRSLRIREDDVVLITASRGTLDLADEVAMECRKAGAETTTTYFSENVWYWSLQKLPLEWLRGASKVDLAHLDVVTATINVGGVVDPRPMARISAERWAANSEGADHWYRKFVQRKIRTATVSLAIVTPQRARSYGFAFAAWKRAVEGALRADYSRIAATGRKLGQLLGNSSAEVHVTSKSGTDLRFRLISRKCRVDDGILDEEDLVAGTFSTNLPAGSVVIAPDERSADGTVVFDQAIPQRGKLIRGLSWSFKNGQVEKFAATKNAGMIIPIWEKSSGDKSRFGLFGIGINHAAKTGYLDNVIVQGAVTLGIGDNREIGGGNMSTFGFQGTLGKSTVLLDGRTIVSEGKLIV
jgi:leucyl aminopeptidase (aminopeptidase T)